MGKGRDGDIGISNAERDEAVSALAEHLATGRLELSECEERCGLPLRTHPWPARGVVHRPFRAASGPQLRDPAGKPDPEGGAARRDAGTQGARAADRVAAGDTGQLGAGGGRRADNHPGHFRRGVRARQEATPAAVVRTIDIVGDAGGAGIRIGDAERDAAAALDTHLSAGLSVAEHEERRSLAAAARTRGELGALFDDLPPPGGFPSRSGSSSSPRWHCRSCSRRRARTPETTLSLPGRPPP
jgi:hypothetical protein